MSMQTFKREADANYTTFRVDNAIGFLDEPGDSYVRKTGASLYFILSRTTHGSRCVFRRSCVSAKIVETHAFGETIEPALSALRYREQIARDDFPWRSTPPMPLAGCCVARPCFSTRFFNRSGTLQHDAAASRTGGQLPEILAEAGSCEGISLRGWPSWIFFDLWKLLRSAGLDGAPRDGCVRKSRRRGTPGLAPDRRSMASTLRSVFYRCRPRNRRASQLLFGSQANSG